MPLPLRFRYLGRRPHGPTAELQEQLADELRSNADQAVEWLLAVEHEPVITIGRRGELSDLRVPPPILAEHGIALSSANRGGQLTYHGPGQLVLYPIVRVLPARFGVGDLVRGLAEVIKASLLALGIEAVYDPKNPGLWVDGAKICAVGMRVSRGVSTHGAAVNVTTDLKAFSLFVPCGMPEASVTRIQDHCPAPKLPDLAWEIAGRFATHFGFRLER